MTDGQGSSPVPPPRALAELPLRGAIARREQIAGRWVVALVGSRPLEELAALPLQGLAGRAPELCGELIEAVRSDDALGRLRDPGLAELTGARSAAELVDDFELLRSVLAEALLEEVPGPSPRQAADLCERVAHVCAVTLARALAGAPTVAPGGRTAVHTGGDSAVGPRAPAPSPTPPLIVDELDGAPATGGEGLGSRGDREGAAAIAIRDQRGEHAPAEWLEAIARELERHEPQELPFAVLLVELRDLERLRLQSTPAGLAADLASLERVLSEQGSVVRERPGRYWVLVPGADRRGARALAERLHAGLSEAGGGESLRALIGLAVYPADGRHAAALAAHAAVDLIAGRAARR